jgi:hypothetical protein
MQWQRKWTNWRKKKEKARVSDYISLTMNTYSHVMPEMLREAAEAMNAVMAGPSVVNS